MFESQIIFYITMNLRYSLYLYYFISQKAFYWSEKHLCKYMLGVLVQYRQIF